MYIKLKKKNIENSYWVLKYSYAGEERFCVLLLGQPGSDEDWYPDPRPTELRYPDRRSPGFNYTLSTPEGAI